MPRKYSEDIFILIKSLSKPEKRYFKYYSSMGSAKESDIYLRVFDVIDAQKKYDEKKLLKKLVDIKPEHLSSKKNYLAERILESLQWYHSGRGIDARLWSFISKISVLHDKGLFKQCMKLIKKAKELSQRYEKHNQLSEIIKWEEKILITSISDDNEGAEIIRILIDNISITKKITSEAEYRLLSGKISTSFAKGGILRNKEMVAIFHKIIQHPLMKNEKTPTSFYGRYYYFRIHGAYYHMMKNWKKSYVFHKKILENFECHKQHINDSPILYIHSLNNFLSSCMRIRKDDEFENTFYKMNQMMRNSVYSDNSNVMKEILSCYGMLLNFHIESGQFQKGILLTYQILPIFNKYSMAINKERKFNIYYTFALNFFGAEKYKDALFWLNKIMNEKDTGVRNDIVTFARLFNLIVHYELGNERAIDNFAEHTYWYLSGKNAMYKIEFALLDFIQKKIPKINSHAQKITSFKELKSKTEIIAKDPYENRSLEYFDLISWLESKISGASFADVVKKKWEKVELNKQD